MAIHKAWHDNTSAGADFDRVARQREVLHTACRPDLLNNPITHEQRTIVNNSQLLQSRTSARRFGPP